MFGLRSILLLWQHAYTYARLRYYRWARNDLQKKREHGHPDLPGIVNTVNHLEHQHASNVVACRAWRANSRTLQAVKNWL